MYNEQLHQISFLNQKSAALRTTDAEASLSYAEEALQLLAELSPATTGTGQIQLTSQLNKGAALLYLSDFAGALQWLLQAESLPAATGDGAAVLELLGFISHTYSRLGNYENALVYQQKHIKLSQEAGDKAQMALAYRNLGIIYGEMGELQASVEQTCKSCELALELADCYGQAVCLNNLCLAYTKSGNYAEALACGQRGITLCQTETMAGQNVERLYGILLANTALAHRGHGDLAQALQLQQQGLSIISQQTDKYWHSQLLLQTGLTYMALEDLAQAEQYVCQALELTQQHQNPWTEYQCHQQLANIYENQGDLAQALAHHRHFHEIYERTFGEENRRKMRHLEISYQVDATQREAELLRQQNEQLEAAVQTRTGELEAALKREHLLARRLEATLAEAESISDLRARIIRTVSHEFRTPLTVINTTAELLTRYHDRMTEEKRQRQHLRIKESILYLTDLLQDVDLVDQVKHDQIKAKPQPWQFGEFARDLEMELRRQTNQSPRISYCLEGDAGRRFAVDEQLLKQVCVNLLTNALKYSEMDETVAFELTFAERLEIRVTDQGIGILPEDAERIWDLFSRGKNTDQRRGMGMGLYIARELVNSLQGEISYVSPLPGATHGTCFSLSIPVVGGKS
ncbi:MAG: tetratricopeptide repeat protein [Ardenticatenales bacterium]|nr:tetratricopeptide repeat protein [Ardenticatenales bacterium]